MTKRPFSTKGNRAKDLLELIHSDVCGPINIRARGGYQYFITFIGDYSRYGYTHKALMADETRGRSANRNGAGPSEPPIPGTMDPIGLLDALVRRIKRASNNFGNNNHATHPLRQTGDKLL